MGKMLTSKERRQNSLAAASIQQPDAASLYIGPGFMNASLVPLIYHCFYLPSMSCPYI